MIEKIVVDLKTSEETEDHERRSRRVPQISSNPWCCAIWHCFHRGQASFGHADRLLRMLTLKRRDLIFDISMLFGSQKADTCVNREYRNCRARRCGQKPARCVCAPRKKPLILILFKVPNHYTDSKAEQTLMWLFHNGQGKPRLLRCVMCHHEVDSRPPAPPTACPYYS